jgi:uncharacterized protein YndB with AHSA1/START domain
VPSWSQQALIDAPVERVWALLEDPARFPEWNAEMIAVTGVPTKIERGSTFDITARGPLRLKATTTFTVEALEDLREIRLRCQTSGFYSHWLLTEAQGQTFTEVELGIERVPGLEGRVTAAIHTKGYLRRATHDTLDGLQRAVSGEPEAHGDPPQRK